MILTKCDLSEIDLDRKIDDLIKSGRLNELLLIVPTNRKVRYLKKEIIAQSPGKSSGKINLETIGTFATNLLSEGPIGSSEVLNPSGRALSEAASSVLLNQSFQECNLKYFENKKKVPFGTLERVKNVISEYKKNGITPFKLKFESSSLEKTEKLKADDIADIYENYQRKCKELNVWEIGDIYLEIVQLPGSDFCKRFRNLYPEVKTIVINGFDEFTVPEIEIINLAAGIENSTLFINFDYYLYNPLIFSHLDSCYNAFVLKDFQPVIDKSQIQFKKFQSIIREKLFKKSSGLSLNEFNSSITKITGRNREKEIELITKEIKDLIIEKKVEPHNICVAFNLIQKYSPIIRDIFSAYGIPFNLTDRYSLSSSPPVIAFINFLEILENDFYYKNILRALSSSYIEPGSNGNGTLTADLFKASVDLKIISGLENWISSLNTAIDNPADSEDEIGFSRDKEVYIHALHEIKKLEEMLSPFSKRMTLKEFGNKFLDLIYSLQIHKKLINNSENKFSYTDENIEKNVKAVTSFIQTVQEILNLLELEWGKEEKFNLKFFLNNIRTAVESSRYNIKERSNYGVQVTTINEIRGLQFDYLFLGGLCDGDFPTRYTPEIFFSGSFIKNEMKHQTEERYHFYQSLCSWKNALYLTCPRNEERQELVQSTFLKDFISLFTINNKDEKNYSSGLYSKEELMTFIGRHNPENFLQPDEQKSFDFERVKNSVEIDKLRLNTPFGNSKYTGTIFEDLPQQAKENLVRYKEKEFSISQLETYAKCPYKYFAERILRLKPAEEPSEEIEALEMGSLLHNILYEFYTELRKKGIVISKASGEEFKKAEDLLFKTADEKIKEGNFVSPLTFFEKEKILGINGNRKNSLLYLFLKTERESDKNFIPEFFEVVFGNLPRDKNQKDRYKIKELKAGNIKIRGKIDRIDINKKEKIFEVIDYKLGGKKPGKEDLDEGISLQLPLYMYAAKELINAQLNKDLEPDIPKIYSLKFKEGEFGKTSINVGFRRNSSYDEKETLINEVINNCLEMVEKFVDDISRGKFNLSTLRDRENKVCRFCSFKSICRIQEVN